MPFLLQIVAVNEVNRSIVPFSEADQILREQDMKGNPLSHHIDDRSALPNHSNTLYFRSDKNIVYSIVRTLYHAVLNDSCDIRVVYTIVMCVAIPASIGSLTVSQYCNVQLTFVCASARLQAVQAACALFFQAGVLSAHLWALKASRLYKPSN